MHRIKLEQTIYLLIFLLTVTLYTVTSYSGVAPADNGEFQWVAATLGLAHPPGFPLYTLLGHFFIQLLTLFNITPAVALNLFAAATSTLTLITLYKTATLLIPQDKTTRHTAIQQITPLIPVLILATSTTFWAQATMANIRSLTALFASLAFYHLIKLDASQNTNTPPTQTNRHLHLFILTIALGLTHHLSLAFIALIMTSYVALIRPRFFTTPRQWGIPLAFIALGFLPWLYLPWGEPTLRSGSAFITYALGLGFQGDFFYYHTAVQLFDRASVMLNVLTFQFPLWFLALSLTGLIWLTRTDWRKAYLLGGSFLIHTFITASYRAPQTVEYMLPAYLPVVLCASYALSQLFTQIERLKRPSLPQPIQLTLILSLTLAILNHATPNYHSFRWLAINGDTAVVTQNWLSQAPPNSVILADWHWYTPLKYLQEVEQQRPDIDIIFVYPRTASYTEDWANDIRHHLDNGRPTIATHYEESAYAPLPPPQAFGDAFLFTSTPITTTPASWQPTTATLGEMLTLHSFDYAQNKAAIDDTLIIDLAWQAPQAIKLSLKLFGPPWQPYAQQDLLVRPQPNGLTVTRFHLTPRMGAPLGDYTLLATATLPDGTPLLLADGNSAATLTTISLSGSPWRPYTTNPTPLTRWRELQPNQTHLIGHDWDNTLPSTPRLFLHWRLPNGTYWTETVDTDEVSPERNGRSLPNNGTSRYVPFAQGIIWTGNTPRLATQTLTPQTTLRTDQHFIATRPLQRDLGIATRLVGYETDLVTWAWLNPDPDNDIPAMGAIPTLKWVTGSHITHPRRLTISSEATPQQQVGGFLRLYDVFTNRPLATRDERHTADGRPWVTFDQAKTP